MLANDEKRHAQLLIDSAKNNSFKLSGKEADPTKENVFSSISQQELKDIAQFDFYKLALEKEKESIDLYADFSKDAATPDPGVQSHRWQSH